MSNEDNFDINTAGLEFSDAADDMEILKATIDEKCGVIEEDDNIKNIVELKQQRRAFSEKLESDPAFRKKFMEEQDAKQAQGIKELIQKLSTMNNEEEAGEDVAEPENPLDLYETEIVPVPKGNNKRVINISSVQKLIINFNF